MILLQLKNIKIDIFTYSKKSKIVPKDTHKKTKNKVQNLYNINLTPTHPKQKIQQGPGIKGNQNIL